MFFLFLCHFLIEYATVISFAACLFSCMKNGAPKRMRRNYQAIMFVLYP